MNILLIGSGGREHALAWKLSQSKLLNKMYIAPGNAGTGEVGENIKLSINDFESIGNFCTQHAINLVIVGPEEPLVKGIADHFQNNPSLKAIPVIGPSKAGAMLEGSKEFAKKFMFRHGIPTAQYQSFTASELDNAISFLKQLTPPYVIKADGLAAGKGVLILNSLEEAVSGIKEMFSGKFGQAGERIVIEEFLSGIELSVFVLTDGSSYIVLPEAKDYKRVGEGDTGPNTGGMGAVSPVPFASAAFMHKVEEKIIKPTISGLQKEAIPYVGFIFFGLIKVNDEPFVIEYNVRMGDPETEVVIPRIQSDLLELFLAVAHKALSNYKLEVLPKTATTVMLVSGGYPGSYQNGREIHNLSQIHDSILFHAGTKKEDNKVLTNGGRVIAITSTGNSIKEAILKSTENARIINFEGKHFRNDIGFDL